MLGSRCEVGGLVIGSLQAYFGDPEGEASGEEHTLVRYLATCAAHMYGDQTGLPVHGDGPVVAALADGLAIVDRDGTVRLGIRPRNRSPVTWRRRSSAAACRSPLRRPGRCSITGCRTGDG